MRVNSGADWQAAIMGTSTSPSGIGTSTYAPAYYIALTQNSTSPSATDTSLTAELNNSGGGLNRGAATYAHTAGASSYTLTLTYTMNSNDGGSVTPAKIGVFNASSSGTMVFETAISSPPTMVPGDELTLTESVNI